MSVHIDDEEEGQENANPTARSNATSGKGAAATSPQQASKPVTPSALMAKPQQATQPAATVQAPAPKTAVVAPQQQPATSQALKTNMNAPMQQSSVLAKIRQSSQAPLSSTAQADAVVKMIEAIRNMVNDKGQDYAITIVPINALDMPIKLFASAVVVCVQRKGEEDKAMAYHTLLLADTAPRSRVDQLQVEQGLIIEVPRVVSDAYDDDYIKVVQGELARLFPNTTHILDAEAEVIPVGYNYKDETLVRKTLANALLAASTILRTFVLDSNFPDIVLTDFTKNGERVDTVARLQFGQPNSADEVGAPVRTDVKMTYSLVTGQQQGKRGTIQSLNTGQQNVDLFTIGGFPDLLWLENENLQGMSQNKFAAPYAPQQPVQGQSPWKYQPRFVITETTTNEFATLPGTLWGLVAATILQKNNNWMGMFGRTGPENDHHDIGAIGIETTATPEGWGTPYDATRSNTFGPGDLYDLLSAFMRPELVFSIDVDESGPSTWQNSVFVAAARNADANQEIIDAADLLTGGHFKRHFQDGERVVIDDQNRIHLGYYTDAKGIVHDIREIDHLAVLNMLGATNPEQARIWSDSMTRLDYTWERRWHERLKVIKLITQNFTITGAAQRVTFTNKFMNALAMATADAGISIRPETPFMEIQATTRGQADWIRQATAGYNPNSNLFNRGVGAGASGPVNNFSTGFGRWR